MKALVEAAPAAGILIVWSVHPAYAYLDPGAGSFLLQSLIGSIAATAAIGGVYFERIKGIVSRLNGNLLMRKKRGN